MNKNERISIAVSPLFFAVFGWLLLYERKGVAAGCLAASLLHECGHLLVMFWRNAPPRSVTVGVFGMRIERDVALHLSFWDDLLIAAGGPLCNAICCIGFWLCGKQVAAAIHLLIALLNLLPVEALDWGEILLCILYRFVSRERARRWMLICSLLTVFPLGIIGFFVLIRSGYNASLLLVDLYLILLLIFKRKD
jgi:membrane-associated protease RseP (regulator of RpoE activity)